MLFISMVRDDITKGTHLDGKEKVKERKRKENQGKCRPRSQVKRILQSLEPFLLFSTGWVCREGVLVSNGKRLGILLNILQSAG